MILKQNKFAEKLREKIGFLFSYLLFTLILFFILQFLNKIPEEWSLLPVAGITLCIVLAGMIIQRLLI